MILPDWLSKRSADLKLAPDGRTWLVMLGGTPAFKLVPAPAKGQYAFSVMQTHNGKRIDGGDAAFASTDEALRAGLAAVQKSLGW